jgi:hypothetical protein
VTIGSALAWELQATTIYYYDAHDQRWGLTTLSRSSAAWQALAKRLLFDMVFVRLRHGCQLHEGYSIPVGLLRTRMPPVLVLVELEPGSGLLTSVTRRIRSDAHREVTMRANTAAAANRNPPSCAVQTRGIVLACIALALAGCDGFSWGVSNQNGAKSTACATRECASA